MIVNIVLGVLLAVQILAVLRPPGPDEDPNVKLMRDYREALSENLYREWQASLPWYRRNR